MKYQRPIVLTIAGAASARCQNGSNPTHDTCTAGTAGPGSGATSCATGYEANGTKGACIGGGGGSIPSGGCHTGYAADSRCVTGNAVGANKGACNNGSTANACNTGTTVTG